jgi:hypothetical protein
VEAIVWLDLPSQFGPWAMAASWSYRHDEREVDDLESSRLQQAHRQHQREEAQS